MRARGEKQVVYGTSDHLLNFNEVLLTLWVAGARKREAVFFHYPKGPEWALWEAGLFEPYSHPPWDPQEALRDAGFPPIGVFPLQMMVRGELGNLTLGEVAGMIRANREIKSFRAISLPDARPVYVSSKNKDWRRKWADRSLGEVVNNPAVKIGGAFIYFFYGAWLAERPGLIGILPGKQCADVIGAFKAGEKWVQEKASVFFTGEFDFMTVRQWKDWEDRGRRGWRKVPVSAIRCLFNSPDTIGWVRRRLLDERLYTPLVYDEEADSFSLKEDLL